MKITAIRRHLMQAGAPGHTGWSSTGKSSLATGRNWFFITIETDSGLIGTGEGSGWPRVVAAAVEDLSHILIGENVSDIERISQKVRVALMGHGNTGVVGMGALAAIDMALWDLNAQALGVPVSRLLGGTIRSQVPYYVHASDVASAKAAVAEGVRAIKVGGLKDVVERAFAIRAAVGDDIDMMVDLHGPPWLTAADAVAIGRDLERLHLLFLEEAVAPDDMAGWKRVRDKVALPLAGGERLASLAEMRPFLENGLLDVVQPDTGRFGGLTQMKKLAAMAEACSVMVAPHSGSLGPVAEFAAIHLLSAIPNGLMLERLNPDWAGRADAIHGSLPGIDGTVAVPQGPGLGVTLNLDFISQYPSQKNIAIATGGWNPDTESETVLTQMRRPRASQFPSSNT
ncbi:MAG TPA: mandelate racemase/muconate lactonizing enzyme family protein [Polaromonas sp.]|uniref:mandelate racemase/muconate lactonizing enzyme family protein n=1 Tax=Polaromonas sp. TaxID=1869339 RepID=UPI002D34DAD2|nr:mandelate racemase/muconate lactonizing enzyme family protein [Polaromonas sp.]HYW55351.1 mandelate racemase/muconate lactonizing enzyme family protein [Polaromonas sp.]